MVTRDTRWPAGTPCWVDVSVDDVPKSIAFYQALFGWDIELGGPEVGGYSIAHQDGRIVAAVSPKMGAPDAPSVWTTYLATDDTDATAAKVTDAGGQVLEFGYDQAGRETRRDLPGGLTLAQDWDAAGQLERQVLR